MEKKNGYSLLKSWFAFAFENPSLVRPIHGALYSWLVELNNRMGWAKEFSSPASQSMAACGISSYNAYKKAMDELADFGFLTVVKRSRNQHTACVVALSQNDKAIDGAIDKALSDHSTKQCRITVQSDGDIIKQPNLETVNKETNAAQAWRTSTIPFSPEAKAAWDLLCSTAKWKKKELPALMLSLKKLVKYPEAFAVLLMENAVAGSYQGVVFDDTDEAFEKWQKSGTKGTKEIPFANHPDPQMRGLVF